MRSLVQSKGRGTGPKCFILRDDQLTVLFQENLDSDRPTAEYDALSPALAQLFIGEDAILNALARDRANCFGDDCDYELRAIFAHCGRGLGTHAAKA